MKREYNKLVRDRVPEIFETSGRKVEYKILSDSQVLLALQEKLLEKAQNFAKRPSENEISDMFELMDTIIEKFQYEQMHIDYLKLKNREAKGGYTKNVYLISVEEEPSF